MRKTLNQIVTLFMLALPFACYAGTETHGTDDFKIRQYCSTMAFEANYGGFPANDYSITYLLCLQDCEKKQLESLGTVDTLQEPICQSGEDHSGI